MPAPLKSDLAVVPYKQACLAEAKVFTDIWEGKDDGEVGSAEDLTWPSDLEHVAIDLPLDPCGLREHALSFRAGTTYGTDVIHPRQVALLSDEVLWLIIELFTAMIRMGYVPKAAAVILIKLIPKPEAGVRPIGIFSAIIRVCLRALRRTI